MSDEDVCRSVAEMRAKVLEAANRDHSTYFERFTTGSLIAAFNRIAPADTALTVTTNRPPETDEENADG